jgi:putative resolvase
MRIFHSHENQALELSVSRDILRGWEVKGKIIAERTPRGHRRYDLAKILGLLPRAQSLQKNTVAYARVSSHDQKDDLTKLLSSIKLKASASRMILSKTFLK